MDASNGVSTERSEFGGGCSFLHRSAPLCWHSCSDRCWSGSSCCVLLLLLLLLLEEEGAPGPFAGIGACRHIFQVRPFLLFVEICECIAVGAEAVRVPDHSSKRVSIFVMMIVCGVFVCSDDGGGVFVLMVFMMTVVMLSMMVVVFMMMVLMVSSMTALQLSNLPPRR